MNNQRSIMKSEREKSFQGLKMRLMKNIKKDNKLGLVMKGK